jgi:hypothetical protein
VTVDTAAKSGSLEVAVPHHVDLPLKVFRSLYMCLIIEPAHACFPSTVNRCLGMANVRAFGGGFGTGGDSDQLQPNYGAVLPSAADCQAYCSTQAPCRKWVSVPLHSSSVL